MVTALTHLVTPLAYLLALVVVGGLLFLLAAFTFGRGEQLAPMPVDSSPVVLPSGRQVTGRDLNGLRLSVVLRGYRMSEVDWVLDQLAAQLDERDREIARLRGAAGRPGGTVRDEGAGRPVASGAPAPSTGTAPTGRAEAIAVEPEDGGPGSSGGPAGPDRPDPANPADESVESDRGSDGPGLSAPS